MKINIQREVNLSGLKVFAVNILAKFIGVLLLLSALKNQDVFEPFIVTTMVIFGLVLIFSTLFIKSIYYISKIKRDFKEKNYIAFVVTIIAVGFFIYQMIALWIA